jgi:IS30 family transposase
VAARRVAAADRPAQGKRGPSVRAFVLQSGGVQRPTPRRRARCLSMADREEISRGVAAGVSCRQLAARLGRAPSTVSRELASNGGRGCYRAQAADAAAFRRAQRPKPAKLAVEPRLRAVVEAKLALRWSPEQIAGWLPLADPSDPVLRVSHETIYLSLFVQSRGGCAGSCSVACARVGRCAIRAASGCPRDAASCATPSTAASDSRGGRPGGARPLGGRPDLWQATQRGRDPGGAPQPLCGVVPAARGICCPTGPPGAHRRHPAAAPAVAAFPHLGPGSGDGRAHPVHRRLRCPGLLLRPAQPWQRGTNENTNGLLRQYLSRNGDLRRFDQAALDAIAAELNGCPRQTLGFKTPSEALAEALR